MPRGGVRAGAGRRAGSLGKPRVSVDRVLANATLDPAYSPLAFLLGVMQDDKQTLTLRYQCAVAAAPYMHSKLSSVEVKGDASRPLQVQSDLGQALAALAELARTRQPDMIELLPSEVTTVDA